MCSILFFCVCLVFASILCIRRGRDSCREDRRSCFLFEMFSREKEGAVLRCAKRSRRARREKSLRAELQSVTGEVLSRD